LAARRAQERRRLGEAPRLFDQLDQACHDLRMDTHVSLYEAKTRLSALVDQAAAGEEIVISKNGVPYAKLVPVGNAGAARVPAGAMGVSFIAEDFDAVDAECLRGFDIG